MLRFILFPLCLSVMGCAVEAGSIGNARPDVLRDIEGYAIASCFSNQSQAYLKDQGDAWAAVIVQRMEGNLDVLASIAEQVMRENAKGDMAVIRDEANPERDKVLPVLYCSEIIDRPSVRAAIKKAVTESGLDYGRQF